MKTARLIYNPNSGDKSFKHSLDTAVDKLQMAGYEILLHRSSSINDIYECLARSGNVDCVLVAGGDGTLNHVVNGMIDNSLNVPLGIFPYGTANDYAMHLGLPRKISDACKVIAKGKVSELYLGKINDRYFVNVAAGGLLTDISQKIDIDMKNTFGKMAYYIKGIEQLPVFKPMNMRIYHDGGVIEESLYLFVILNGSSAGGFRLSPHSSAQVDKLDFIGFKPGNMLDVLNFLIKFMKGEHLESNNVLYLSGQKFRIECDDNIETDIDGEEGPMTPIEIRVSTKKIKVFTP